METVKTFIQDKLNQSIAVALGTPIATLLVEVNTFLETGFLVTGGLIMIKKYFDYERDRKNKPPKS